MFLNASFTNVGPRISANVASAVDRIRLPDGVVMVPVTLRRSGLQGVEQVKSASMLMKSIPVDTSAARVPLISTENASHERIRRSAVARDMNRAVVSTFLGIMMTGTGEGVGGSVGNLVGNGVGGSVGNLAGNGVGRGVVGSGVGRGVGNLVGNGTRGDVGGGVGNGVGRSVGNGVGRGVVGNGVGGGVGIETRSEVGTDVGKGTGYFVGFIVRLGFHFRIHFLFFRIDLLFLLFFHGVN